LTLERPVGEQRKLHKIGLCSIYLSTVTGIIKLRGLILTGHKVGIRNEKCKKNFCLKLRKDLACRQATIMDITEIKFE
jgi:hypothetical protein